MITVRHPYLPAEFTALKLSESGSGVAGVGMGKMGGGAGRRDGTGFFGGRDVTYMYDVIRVSQSAMQAAHFIQRFSRAGPLSLRVAPTPGPSPNI